MLQGDGRLVDISFQANGACLAKALGGACSSVRAAASNFPRGNDPLQESLVIMVQSYGMPPAITLQANGAPVVKGAEGRCSGPKGAAGVFSPTSPVDVYVLSPTEANGVSAALFFKADGTLMAKALLSHYG